MAYRADSAVIIAFLGTEIRTFGARRSVDSGFMTTFKVCLSVCVRFSGQGDQTFAQHFYLSIKVYKNDGKVLFLQELELTIRILERPKTIHVSNVAPTAVERVYM